MKALAPLEMLIGHWTGKGTGSYGPFKLEAHVERRGRWLLMRQEIRIPIVGITTYVSTQVYGFDDKGLTLDYFDTAGAFRFRGARDNDTLQFEWRDGDSRKTSRYWKDGGIIHFSYDSNAREGDSSDLEHVTFEGTLERAVEP